MDQQANDPAAIAKGLSDEERLFLTDPEKLDEERFLVVSMNLMSKDIVSHADVSFGFIPRRYVDTTSFFTPLGVAVREVLKGGE